MAAGLMTAQLYSNQQRSQLDHQARASSALQNGFTSQLQTPINHYLNQGDAQMLTQANLGIESLLKQLAEFDAELAAAPAGRLRGLQSRLNNDYRSAGKLAGNPGGCWIMPSVTYWLMDATWVNTP